MDKFIDIDQVLAEKSPALAKTIPRFVKNYLKRIVHEDELNEVVSVNKGKSGLEFSKYVLNKYHIHVSVNGLENIPSTGGVIIAANHPLGGMDALAMVQEFSKVRSDFQFVVNDILLHLENMKDLFVGVNKHGGNTKTALIQLNELFESDKAVVVFPAGLVSRKKKGVLKDLEWQKTFISRARKYQKNVIPVHVSGQLSPFFYRLSNLRSFFGIKANLEMLYLVDETTKQRNKNIHIHIGKPINFTTFDNSKSDYEWAQEVKEKVYQLK